MSWKKIARRALAGAVGNLVAAGTLQPAIAADRAIRPIVPTPPAVVAPTAAGDLLLGFGPMWADELAPGEHLFQFQSLGRANVPLGNRWNLEAQADGKALFATESGIGTFGQPFQAAAYLHLWAQHTANSAWGIFGGASPFEFVFWSLGAEAKHYLPHASFGFAAAVTGFQGAFSNAGQTGWTVNAETNWYFNPNHRIGLSAAMTSGFDFGSSGSGAVWQITADFEHRAASLPLSLWLSASREHSPLAGDAWLGLAGFRIFMDRPGSTLQSHEKDVPWTYVTPNFFLGAT